MCFPVLLHSQMYPHHSAAYCFDFQTGLLSMPSIGESSKENNLAVNGVANGSSSENGGEDEDDTDVAAEPMVENLKKEFAEPTVKDIEDVVVDEERQKALLEKLDKTRGFMKYKRATYQYRNAGERLKDWNEVFNHRTVMGGLRVQAAR